VVASTVDDDTTVKGIAMRWNSKILVALALSASGLVANGCGSEAEEGLPTTSSQTEWSKLAEKDRDRIRGFLEYFGPGGTDGIDLRVASSVVVGEGIRNFAGGTGVSSLVLTGRTLDMTADTVLPENGASGVYEPTGGFVPFEEVEYDASGDEVRTETIRKRGRGFEAGSIDDFGYSRTVDSPRPDYVLSTERQSFRVAKDVKYVETLWNQSIEWTSTDSDEDATPPHGQKFAYQSQPTMVLTLKAGNHLSISRDKTDRIHSEAISDRPEVESTRAGWETRSAATTTGTLTGTITLFRPKRDNVPENDDVVRPYETDFETADGQRTEQGRGTSLERNSAPTADDPEVIETTTTRRTNRLTRVSTTRDGNLVREESEVHTTTKHHFSLAGAEDGSGSAALSARDFEVTTRELVKVTVTDDGDRRTVRTEETVYRYTDQPGVRNDLRNWMSTRSVTEEVLDFDDLEAGTRTTFGGTEWLTDQIEEDPDFSNVPFTFDGKVEQITETVGRFFGADNSGLELNETDRLDVDLRTGFGDEKIGMKGNSVERRATLTVEGVAEHQISGDGDGKFEVTVGDQTIVASSEEWRGTLVPAHTLMSWLELASPPGPIPPASAIDATGGGGGGGGGVDDCPEGTLACRSGECIDVGALCDTFADCPGGEDEAGCGGEPCADPAFTCGDGTCLDRSSVCDGFDDCSGGEDEVDCGGEGESCHVEASVDGQGMFACDGFEQCSTFVADFCGCFVFTVFEDPSVCEAYVGSIAPIDACFNGSVSTREMLQATFDGFTNAGLAVQSAEYGASCIGRPTPN
jgi:hypothetical protein